MGLMFSQFSANPQFGLLTPVLPFPVAPGSPVLKHRPP